VQHTQCLDYSIVVITPTQVDNKEYRAIVFDSVSGEDVYMTSVRLSANQAECDALHSIHEQESQV
jgi:hypothetical protein